MDQAHKFGNIQVQWDWEKDLELYSFELSIFSATYQIFLFRSLISSNSKLLYEQINSLRVN